MLWRHVTPPLAERYPCEETALGQERGVAATTSLSKEIFLQLIFILLKLFGHSEKKPQALPLEIK